MKYAPGIPNHFFIFHTGFPNSIFDCDHIFRVESKALEFSDIEDWKWIFDVNVFGNVRLIKHFLPLLKKSGRGRIIINTSLAGFSAMPFFNA